MPSTTFCVWWIAALSTKNRNIYVTIVTVTIVFINAVVYTVNEQGSKETLPSITTDRGFHQTEASNELRQCLQIEEILLQ